MMKAREVHYNPRDGIVTAEGDPLAEKRTVTEAATGIDVVADSVSVRADPGRVLVEAVGEEPLLVRLGKDGETVRVLTPRRPERVD